MEGGLAVQPSTTAASISRDPHPRPIILISHSLNHCNITLHSFLPGILAYKLNEVYAKWWCDYVFEASGQPQRGYKVFNASSLSSLTLIIEFTLSIQLWEFRMSGPLFVSPSSIYLLILFVTSNLYRCWWGFPSCSTSQWGFRLPLVRSVLDIQLLFK